MGVIRIQTIKGTLFTYLGAGLGLVTNLFLLPNIFTPQQIGLINVIVAYSLLFAMFASVGFDNVTLRLFPYFRNTENKHNGFLFIMLSVILSGFVLAALLYFIFQPFIVANSIKTDGLLAQYVIYILPLTLVILLFNSFDAYSRMLYKSVRGTFLKEFLQRIFIILAIVLFILNLYDFKGFIFVYVLGISLPAILLLWLIAKDKQLNFRPKHGFVNRELRKSMISVSFFGIITVFASSVIISIDKIMIESMLNLTQAGIYSIVFFFGVIISMPSRALAKISSTVVAEAWKNNDLQIVKTVYYKSCLNQMIFSVLLLIGIWANIKNVSYILPGEYAAGKFVIFWVCFGSFIDMSTGINNTIIATSKYYKAQSLFMLIFVLIVIGTNYLFIPVYGITGAGLANAISLFLFNLMRWIFLWNKFDFQPFNYKYLLILLFSVIAYLPGYFLPEIKPYLVDIIIRSGIIFIIFSLLIYFSKVSDDINNRVNTYLPIIFRKKN